MSTTYIPQALLFHPNQQDWFEHFTWQADGLLVGSSWGGEKEVLYAV